LRVTCLSAAVTLAFPLQDVAQSATVSLSLRSPLQANRSIAVPSLVWPSLAAWSPVVTGALTRPLSLQTSNLAAATTLAHPFQDVDQSAIFPPSADHLCRQTACRRPSPWALLAERRPSGDGVVFGWCPLQDIPLLTLKIRGTSLLWDVGVELPGWLRCRSTSRSIYSPAPVTLAAPFRKHDQSVTVPLSAVSLAGHLPIGGHYLGVSLTE